MEGLEHLPLGGQAESWDCSAWRRELQGDLTSVCKYLKGGCGDGRLFSVVPSDRTRGSGHRLKHRKVSEQLETLDVVLL